MEVKEKTVPFPSYMKEIIKALTNQKLTTITSHVNIVVTDYLINKIIFNNPSKDSSV